MLLALIILQLSVLVAANPFHNYPFVFLLDVGNEELKKTNTEQIRLNSPGGSVALRYPAIGNGNTIGHIRVSGIDFGTDLKANIVDGGPGYKYVVLVFMGNQGVPYDAVVTVQTVNDGDLNAPGIEGTVSDTDRYQIQDINNSAEDLSEDSVVTNTVENGGSADIEESNIQMNAEQMQSSSNVYNYAQSEVIENNDGYDEEIINHGNNSQDGGSDEEQIEDEVKSIDETINENDQQYIYEQYSDNKGPINDPSNQEGEEADDDDDNNEEINSQLGPSPAEAANDDDVYSYDNLRQRFNGEAPENYEQNGSKPDYQQEPLDYEEPDDNQPMYNVEEVHNSYKYKDSNNNNYNNIDSDDSYAVAY